MAHKSLPIVVDALHRYLADVKRYPYLTREEEEELAKLYYDKGDLAAAKRLVLSNLRFVVKIAYEYSKSGWRLMDLIQEGNIGLMKAVKEFNPYKEFRLITYATWWIRAYIHNFLMKNFSVVKIGTTQAQRKLFYKLSQEKKKLEALGLSTDIKLLAHNLDVKEEEVAEMEMRLGNKDVSLNAPLGLDSTDTLIDIQPSHDETADVKFEEEDLSKKFKSKVNEFVATLNEKQRTIFYKRLYTNEPLTLQDIADTYKITRERVRQIESNILKKMRDFLGDEAKDYQD